MKILLASQSPRRKELLATVFDYFDIAIPNIDENYAGATPELTVKEIAKRKAEAVELGSYDLLIASDTLVFCDNKYLGKPKDSAEAKKILRFLSGKEHKVVSGLAIKSHKTVYVIADTAYVKFKDLTDKDIDSYVKNHFLLDKAGAYAIQDGVVVDSYRGDYTSIMGLPLIALRKALKDMGYQGKYHEET